MKKRLLTALLVVAAAGFALGGGQASASPESSQSTAGITSPALLALITNDDLFATTDLSLLLDPAGTHATQHYGAYSADSTDSGTCGVDWASDTFDRHFTVRHNPDGTTTVVEQFKNGSFVTNMGPSPGACDSTDGTPPGEVDAGITGTMHGYFIIPVPVPQSSNSPFCDATNNTNADCTTATFVNSHFLGCDYPNAPCAVSTFFFHYAAGDQGLVEHEWKNASCDRGGNHGDIASSNVGITPPFLNDLCL
jgi:hypothetical protein